MPSSSKYKMGRGESAENRAALPIQLAVGRTNIRVSTAGAAAALGRELNKGFQELAQNFRWFVNQLNEYMPEDMEAAILPTFELSQIYCPVDSGDLKESGYLEVGPFRGGSRVEIGYARNGVPDYAIYVHEMPYAHAPPTRDKFLEAAVDEDYFNILQRLADRVRTRVG